MTQTLADSTIAGIDLLNRKAPGWRTHVDLTILDLANSRHCVLGQLYGTYTNGVTALGLDPDVDPYQYGFNTRSGRYDTLTDMWHEALSL